MRHASAHPRQAGAEVGRLGSCQLCGLDEVGRGALAGPLVAAAVVLPEGFLVRVGPLARLVRDSKTLTRRQRRLVEAAVRRHALTVQLELIPVADIEANGIGWANREVFRRLLSRTDADEYVVDGNLRPDVLEGRPGRVRSQVKADSLVPAVAAASIVAKVYRDGLMAAFHSQFPVYGWDRNAGYCTWEHVAALRAFGPCVYHRSAFVASALSHRR